MAKTVIPMDNYEPPKYEDYTGDPPPAGWYNFELDGISWIDEEEGTHRFVFRLVDNELYKGWTGMIRGDMDEKLWLSQQASVAIRGSAELAKKKPVTIPANAKELAAELKAARKVKGQVIVRTNAETGDRSYYLQKVRPLLEDVSAAKKTAPVVEEEPVAEGPVDYTADDLEGMSLAELKKIMKDEFEATLDERKEIKNVAAAVKWILTEQEPAEDEDEEPEDEEELEPEDSDEDDDEEDDEDEDLEEFDEEDEDDEEEPEPEPEPAPRRRATKTAPAKAAPAKAAPAKAATTTRRRRA
jgi:hypothetical protein